MHLMLQNVGWIEVITGCMFCHRLGQPVLMADGRICPIESVQIGVQLMGPDGPVTVTALHRGVGEMAEVRPRRGEPFVVTLDHELTVIDTPRSVNGKPSERGGRIVDVTVREWLEWRSWKKNIFKLFRVGVQEFAGGGLSPDDLDPYFLGAMLGDGSMGRGGVAIHTTDAEIAAEVERQAKLFSLRVSVDAPTESHTCPAYRIVGRRGVANPIADKLRALDLWDTRSGTKFIPHRYKTASVEDRLALLAGLMDTDGNASNGAGYDYISKSPRLAEDVAFVARSLGLHAAVNSTTKRSQNGTAGVYHRVYIGGEVSKVPVRVPRKKIDRVVKHRPTVTAFDVEVLPDPEPYFGVTVQGGRYLLGDFMVTHNSGKTEELIRRVRRAMYARQPVVVFKPKIDSRYSEDSIGSHSGHRLRSIQVDHAHQIPGQVGAARVVGIDEAQFLGNDLIQIVEDLANDGLRVIVAGLDMDFRGIPFDPIPQLLARAEYITKNLAICTVCGNPADRSQRLVDQGSRVLVGATELYEARCRLHWSPDAFAGEQTRLPLGPNLAELNS